MRRALLQVVAAVGTATAVAFAPQQPLSRPACRQLSGCCGAFRGTGICLAQNVAKSRASPCPLRMAGGEEGGMSDADLQGLLARVSAVKDRVQTLPLCVLDATLPLQRLEFATDDTSFQALLAGCKQRAGGSDLGTFGMLGVDRANRIIMRKGTEVEILKADKQADGSVAVELLGTRCFQLVGDPWLEDPEAKTDPAPAQLEVVATSTQGRSQFIVGRVEYAIDPDASKTGQLFTEEVEELSMETEQLLDDMVGQADMEANLQQSRELEELVDTWCDLVVQKGFEREPGQVSRIIRVLGDMPPADKPHRRAMWVAALINPIPALGVALEIRPAVLQASSVANALGVVTQGIRSSIDHVNGTKPLF